MVFTSPIFIFYFLPVFFAVYGIVMILRRLAGRSGVTDRVPDRSITIRLVGLIGRLASFWLANLTILLFSVIFYFWEEKNATFILLGVIAFNFLLGCYFDPGNTPATRKIAVVGCIVANLACLIVFKYAAFFVVLFNEAFGVRMPIPTISLPLGISFFIFQAMSYAIDVYRGTTDGNKSFVGFACYIAMFPQLVAGPIVRYSDIAAQLETRSVSLERFALGVERFVFGLAKKVLVANNIAPFVDAVFAMQTDRVTPTIAWAGTVCYAVQIYYDFSGYSDMAIGLGKMLGFDLKENFRHPYAAVSMQDFWRRWHISLSSWFKDYLYIPLGGNRRGNVRTYVNLVIVFLLCGLWHGAAVNFILWGLYHGAFLVFERIVKIDFSKHFILGSAYALVVILFGWLLFRAESAEQIMTFANRMLCLDTASITDGGGYIIWYSFNTGVRTMLAVGIVLSFPVYEHVSRLAARINAVDTLVCRLSYAIWRISLAAIIMVLFLACIPFIIGDSYNPFIYFRF